MIRLLRLTAALGLVTAWLASCAANPGTRSAPDGAEQPPPPGEAAVEGTGPQAGEAAVNGTDGPPGRILTAVDPRRLRLPEMEILPTEGELKAGQPAGQPAGVIARPPTEGE